MIELYELRQFAAFAKTGTLSEASQYLHLSQPALSRNMKKLESDLGVSIFARTKNKIELNENGQYLLSLVQKILADTDSLASKVQEFDLKKRTITLGLCAPAPIWFLAPLIATVFPSMPLQSAQDTNDRLLFGLDHDIYQLVVLYEKPVGDSYFYQELGKESLMFALPREHKYATRKSLTFSDINGEAMLLMSDIGFWNFVTEKMPDSRFLIQNDRFNFVELAQASSLPFFVTEFTEKYSNSSNTRICVPVSDKEATVTYYLVCKADSRKHFQTLFSALYQNSLRM